MDQQNLQFRHSSRIGLVYDYLEIAIDSYIELLADRKEYEGDKELNGDHFEFFDRQKKGTIKVIIFLSFFLEAYINDLAGTALGDNYSRDHLDKLDVVSKWIIIPRLISGKEIDKSKAYFGQFKKLIQWRNKLAHHKSKDASIINQPWTKQHAEQFRPIYDQINVDNLFTMVTELFEELDRIDKPGLHSFSIHHQLQRFNR